MLLLGGGAAALSYLHDAVRKAQLEQKELCAELSKPGSRKRAKVAVDKVFARRLLRILSM